MSDSEVQTVKTLAELLYDLNDRGPVHHLLTNNTTEKKYTDKEMLDQISGTRVKSIRKGII